MEPWNDEPFTIWRTKPAFFSWLRGQLRRSWSHYPPARNFKNSRCRPNVGGGRAKFVGDCSICHATLAKSHLQIDHVIPAGSIVSWETAGTFLKGLFTTSDNMRLVCLPCHKLLTTMERFSFTAEQADIHRRVMLFSKLTPIQQKTALTQLGLNPSGNAALRRKTYTLHLESES